MDLLEKWAVQTYEGKKVTFGFVISPKAEQVKLLKKDWFKFLGDDYAAVLTDCFILSFNWTRSATLMSFSL